MLPSSTNGWITTTPSRPPQASVLGVVFDDPRRRQWHVYIATVMQADGTGSAPNGAKIGQLVKGTNTGANTWQIAYAHNLSKRTYVYTGYPKINNDHTRPMPATSEPCRTGPIRAASAWACCTISKRKKCASGSRRKGTTRRSLRAPVFSPWPTCASTAISFASGENPCPPESTLVTFFVAILLAAPFVRAQDANVTLYGRVNVDMEIVNGKQTGSGCPDNCPNPNVFRVIVQFIAIWNPRCRIPREWRLRDLPDREWPFVDRRPRRPGQPRNVPRAVRASGYVQDGLFSSGRTTTYFRSSAMSQR